MLFKLYRIGGFSYIVMGMLKVFYINVYALIDYGDTHYSETPYVE